MEHNTMRTWAEVDLNALEHNYIALKSMVPCNCQILAPVKADAYGHGALEVSRKLEKLGCAMLAVACVDEALQLRQGGVTAPILCLGYTPFQYAPLLLEQDVEQTVGDLDTALALSAAATEHGGTITVQLKVDTGMGRIGFYWGDEDNCTILDQLCRVFDLPGLVVSGLFTHFSDADGATEDYTLTQFARFEAVRNALTARGHEIPLCHCAASAATIRFPQTHLDMVRPGIALYGYYPDDWMDGMIPNGLHPVLKLKSRVAVVRKLPAGTSISYGRTATLEKDSTVAVLPIGYGDGLPRLLSNQMTVDLNGQSCPILGRVCMDMCMVDVSHLPDIKPGDVAEIYGPGLTQQAAKLSGTIVYELLTHLSPRVPRLYLD